ncbi:Gibberellin 3-beta-dioxygenase 1 [Carex littledalei]|uniref:Gibberellin 3-beta-dioxygenase 1 n=1 Tax=Carex littledalei TaxID=544730 RepID=A0A833QC53_9POAL|nr:Gibberellin 3-beta-dioxygenase 1 [Carex littledalei]
MSSQASVDLKIHHPQNFRFNSIPDSHDWSDLYDHPSAQPIGLDSVPVIDLNDPNLIYKIRKACAEWGVFLIRNHGIEPELLNRFGSQIHRLFALPVEVKLKVAKTEGTDSGYGGVPISQLFPKFMWYEGFAITTASSVDHAQILWPDDYSSFCEVIEEYKKAIIPLGYRLMHLMLLSLGLTEEEIDNSLIGDSTKIKNAIHLNSYPACPDPDRVVGLAPHTDTGFVTILYHNGVSGLQVLRRKDDIGPARWVTVPVVPNTFVVNICDLMHVLSNGTFHNVVHRSMVSKTNQRLSAAYFFGPQVDVKVGPLSELMGPEQGLPLYRPVTWLELQKLKSTLHDKALQSMKIDGKIEELRKGA